MIRFFSIFLSLSAIIGSLHAQCFSGNDVFGNGEQASYTVSYNWGPVWVDAGLVTFSANSDTRMGKPVWHLRSTGKTFPSYDLLYKVRDYYDTWIDPATFNTVEFRRYIFEGGYTLQNTLVFDHTKGRVLANTKSNNNPMRVDTLHIKPCTYDMLGAVYFVRTLDMANMKQGFQMPVNVFIDDSTYHIYIRFAGREVVENTDGKRYRCLKFHAKMVEGTIFKGEEDVSVWVTDDKNKVPIYIEAHIQVGTIKAYMKEMKGLKWPVTSLVK